MEWVATIPTIQIAAVQVVLDLAEMGHNTEACLHHLLTCSTPVKLHDRPLPTAEELDLMQAILGPRGRPQESFKRIKLVSALQQRAATMMERENGKTAAS